MKLIFAIVQDDDAGKVVDLLIDRGFRATRFDSRGGFLRAKNSTIMTGVEDDEVNAVLDAIRSTCKSRMKSTISLPPIMDAGEAYVEPAPIDVQVGGATIFVLPIERFERT